MLVILSPLGRKIQSYLVSLYQDFTGWGKPQLFGSVMPMQAWAQHSPSELSSAFGVRMTQEAACIPSAVYFPALASSSRMYWSVRSFCFTCSIFKSLVLLELNSVSVLRSVSPLLKYLS